MVLTHYIFLGSCTLHPRATHRPLRVFPFRFRKEPPKTPVGQRAPSRRCVSSGMWGLNTFPGRNRPPRPRSRRRVSACTQLRCSPAADRSRQEGNAGSGSVK